jgi:molybdenum cofactor cytidylyltransferase
MSIAAIILAAGRSSRMGENKMLAEVGGEPLVRRTARSVLASRCRPVVLVAGHEAGKVRAAVRGLDLGIVANPRYAEGLSTSLVTGIGALSESAEAALICLGDMPLVQAETVEALLGGFEGNPGVGAVLPAYGGEWGNPVLLARKLFVEIGQLTGDAGARKLLRGRDDVLIIETTDASVLIDTDTPHELAQLRDRLGHASQD